MQNLRNKLIAGCAVLILAAIGTVMNRQAAQAAGAPVNIESPIPLPVTGTIAATQSGTWIVGLTGTPGVNINNSPTVSLAPGTTILARNLDDPGRIAYETGVHVACSGGSSCSFVFPTVPAGRSLVVEHLFGTVSFLGGPPTQFTVTATALNFVLGNDNLLSNFFANPGNGPLGFMMFNQPVLFYVPSNGVFSVTVDSLTANIVGNAVVNASGYELDCNAAPCAAIATQ
jgi:hypothetical protein